MVPTRGGERDRYDVEGAAQRVCRDVIAGLDDATWYFPAGVVLVTDRPTTMCTSLKLWAVLFRHRKLKLEADAGCFTGQVGEGREFTLHIPSQNSRH
jgi:hypothetical protein